MCASNIDKEFSFHVLYVLGFSFFPQFPSVKKCMVYDALSSEQRDLAHYYQWLHSQKEEYVKHNHYNEKNKK